MKISDIIRGTAQQAQEPVVRVIKIQGDLQAEPEHDHTNDSELLRMRQIAGLVGTGDTEYSNSPEEKYAPLDAVIASGDDVHKSKHPSDIRADSMSMYPNFQARG